MRSHLELLGWRSLLVAVAALVLLPALVGAALLGPWAPWALSRADGLAVAGSTSRAIAAYERVGTFNFSEHDRAEALYRGALVAAAEGRQPERAVELLQRLVDEHPGYGRLPEALARQGVLLGSDLGAPARAARSLQRAVELAPSHPDASDWLLEAGTFAELAGATQQSLVLRERAVAQFPAVAPRAWAAMARMKLRGGDAHGASALYERVLQSEHATVADQELARLGLSFCLEDLGDHDAAIAELDEDAPELAERRERLQERNEARLR